LAARSGTIIETDADVARAVEALRARCKVMAAIIPLAGQIPLRRREPGFEGLCRIIVAQQVSVASANAIWARVAAMFDPLQPGIIASATDEQFAAAGLSRPKMRTLRAVSDAVLSGALPLEALSTMSADAIKQAMVQVKGIGPWTADIFAMFCVGHADAFAPGDLALQEAARMAFGRKSRPDAKALDTLARRWRPHRAVAARVLWAYYAAMKTREGVTA
jgi:DNA-3-methyladenine glycosylase II